MTDRELDALVAEKVMGFGEIVRGSVDYYVDRFGPLPHYSTEIDAAWRVIERVKVILRERHIGTPDSFVKVHLSEKGHDIECLFDRDGHRYIAVASTVELAICLAALRALGEEV